MNPSFNEIASSEPVTFLVGNEEKRFFMHAGVITGLSRALDVLTNGSCNGAEKLEEARTGIITWRDVDEDTFIRFFQFAYTGDYYPATTPTVDALPNVDPVKAVATEPPEAAAEDVQAVEAAESDVWASFPPCKAKKSKKTGNGKEVLWRKFKQLDYEDKEAGVTENSISLTYNHSDICLSHARVYVLADYYGIDRLMSLSLRKLHNMLMSMIPSAEGTLGFADLVRYSFKHTVDKCGTPDQLRHMLGLYAACRLEEFWVSREFQDLFKSDGEFSCEVITNVLARLN